MNEDQSYKDIPAFYDADRLLAIASHDIKNPLQAIQLEAQMLLRITKRHERTLLSHEVEIQAHRILKTSHRLASILTDIIDRRRRFYKTSEQSNDSEINMMQIIWDVFDTLRPIGREKNQKLILNSNFDRISYKGSYTNFFQLFTNLIGNSLKFSPLDSKVCISVKQIDGNWSFSITDEGPGISEELIDTMFDEFVVGKAEQCGDGLGLFTCRNIVNQYGGTIKASNSNPGAKFEVLLPIKTSELPYS